MSLASGIGINDECKTIFNEFKQNKSLIKYIVYKISDNKKEVVVDFVGKLKSDKPKTDQDKTDEGETGEDKTDEGETGEGNTSRDIIYGAETSVEDIYNDFRENITSITTIVPGTETRKPAPRYAVFDVIYKIPDEGTRNRIIFISWVPEGSGIKSAMVHASTKEVLKNYLDITFSIHADQKGDLEWKYALEEASRGQLKA